MNPIGIEALPRRAPGKAPFEVSTHGPFDKGNAARSRPGGEHASHKSKNLL